MGGWSPNCGRREAGLLSRALVNATNKRKAGADQVSELTTNRLSVYLRCLNQLEAAGVRDDLVSGAGRAVPPQRRPDPQGSGLLRRVRGAGVGYYVKDLRRHLRQILGLDRRCGGHASAPATWAWPWPTIRASARKASRSSRCSTSPTRRSGIDRGAACRSTTSGNSSNCAQRALDIAVIAVPAESAQPVVDRWLAAGMKAILNFSPGALKVPAGVKLKSVDLTVSLESLSFYPGAGGRRWRLGHAPRGSSAGVRKTRGRGRAGSPIEPRCRTSSRTAGTMVDVGDKAVTDREAVARGHVIDVGRGPAPGPDRRR